MVCYVGLVYPRPRFGFLSRGEAVRGKPAQYISMRAPETTVVVPNGSHYRDSQYIQLPQASPSEVHSPGTVFIYSQSKIKLSYMVYLIDACHVPPQYYFHCLEHTLIQRRSHVQAGNWGLHTASVKISHDMGIYVIIRKRHQHMVVHGRATLAACSSRMCR